MSSIYLQKIVLSNFRTYGPNTEIDIGEGPGLTVLCGMNGLGKTAFFEAIEWALTGDVRRLSDKGVTETKMERALSRLGTHPGSHAVELHFDDESTVKRARSISPKHEDLVRLLRHDGWQPEIRDIGTYVRLTHFLPQASGQRFLAKEDDQWQLLKGPAGVERLERFRALLNDGKARNAFRRTITELTRTRDESAALLAKFREMLALQHRFRAIATAGAAISPHQIDADIRELNKRLHELGVLPNSILHSNTPAAEKLSSLATMLEELDISFQQKERTLATADRILSEWNEARARFDSVATRLNSVETESTNRRLTLEQANAPLILARAELSRVEHEKKEFEERSEGLRRLVEARRKTESLGSQLSPLNEKIREMEISIATREMQKARNAEASQKRDDLLRANAGLLKSRAVVDAAAELYATAIEAKRSADVAAAFRADLIAKQSDAQLHVQSAVNAVVEMEREVARLRALLEADKITADAIAKAVAEIAIRLTENDAICPVCTHLHNPGDLLEKARKSMAVMRPGTAPIAEELADMLVRLRNAREAEEKATRQVVDATTKLSEIDFTVRNADQSRAAVEADPFFAGVAFSGAAAVVDAKLIELRSRGETIAKEIASLPTAEVLSAERIEHANAMNSLKLEEQSLGARRALLIQQLEQCRAIIEGNAQIMAEAGNAVAELEAARAKSLRSVEELTFICERVRNAVRTAEQHKHLAQEAVAEAEMQLAAAKRELADTTSATATISKTWQDCGLTGEPNAAELSQYKTVFSNDQITLQELRERHRKSVEGIKLWALNEEVQSIGKKISQTLTETKSSDTNEAELHLTDRLRQAESALVRAEAAFLKAQEIAAALEQKSEEFSTASLEPLTERIAAFNDIISPFGYGYRLAARVTSTRTRTRQTVSILDPKGLSSDCDPGSYLSEGQTSALGMSVLFGASMEYRWSRWPALLLDDPLQNTDLIHAAAFIEVIRGLMLDRKLQIIISTHDRDEADFIARKCLRAKVPVTRVDLLSFGPDGLRTKVRTL